jgi:hypothetical protein
MYKAAAPSGIAFVPGQVVYRSPAMGTLTATLSSNITAGNLVLACVFTSGSTITSVVGGGTENYSAIAAIYDSGHLSPGKQQCYYFANSSGGYNSVVVTQDSSGDWGEALVSEWSGAALSSVVDVSQLNATASDAVSIGPIGPTSAKDLVFVFGGNSNQQNITSLTGGFSLIYNDATRHTYLAYKVQAAAGSETFGAATSWYGMQIMGALKPQ